MAAKTDHPCDELPSADAIGELADDICAASAAVGPWPARLARESADAYFARLIDAGAHDAAVRFAAARMGPRLATWWGSLCAWNAVHDQEEDNQQLVAAVDAAVRWVLEHDEASRRAAQAAAAAAGLTNPCGAVAAAAFWSGGSVSLPDRPEVPAPAGVCAKLVANAVLMAAAAPSAARRDASLLQSLRIAAEVLATSPPWAPAGVREPQA